MNYTFEVPGVIRVSIEAVDEAAAKQVLAQALDDFPRFQTQAGDAAEVSVEPQP